MRLFIIILISVGVLGASFFLSIPAFKEMQRSKAIEKEINALKEEAEKISKENNFLREQVQYLESDHYKERLAKDKLNLRNPGEKIVMVQPVSEKDKDIKGVTSDRVGGSDEKEDNNMSNFKKWWEYFFN